MYLSRVEIDVKNRRKIKDLTHLGAYHNWVEQSFPDEIEQGIRSRKLWRIDKLNGKLYLLVVSEKKPDLKLLEVYGVEGTAQTKNYDRLLNAIYDGNKYFFRAVLNPVHASYQGPSKRGREYPLITIDQQMEYLAKRAESHGFKLVNYHIVERKYDNLRKTNNRKIRLSKVAYEGELIVSNTALFRNTLTHGIGREKAYGCGMITVIPEVK